MSGRCSSSGGVWAEWLGDYTRWKQAPPWVIEGSARWAGEVRHATTLSWVTTKWETYLGWDVHLHE